MKKKYINKNKIIIASILTAFSFSASANINGDFNIGISKVDMLYEGNSLNLDSESVSVGLNLNFKDYYKIGLTYSDMAKESDKYELSLGYLKPINERVSLTFGGSYIIYDGAFIENYYDVKMKSINFRIGTEIKLNRDVTFSLGLERYDADYDFSYGEERDISTEFYAGLNYDFDDVISVSLYRREMLQETGIKLYWRF